MTTERLTDHGIDRDNLGWISANGHGHDGDVWIGTSRTSSEVAQVNHTISPAAARHLADVLNRAADEAERARWESVGESSQEESA